MKNGVVGNCALALREAARPDIKQTKSALMGTILRLGDVENHPEEAIELSIKTSKCTALQRPKSWKKFGRREDANDATAAEKNKVVFAQLQMRTEYYIDRSEEQDEDAQDASTVVDADGDQVMKDEEAKDKEANLEKVEKEQLIRGFKYGATYVPCPDGQYPRLNTKRGMDICGFFHAKNVRTSCSAHHPCDRPLGSFAVNSRLVRYNMCGRTPINLNSKSRCRPSCRPCTRRTSWR
jgi:ATP-dependent DNA helicase 2 subunit 2